MALVMWMWGNQEISCLKSSFKCQEVFFVGVMDSPPGLLELRINIKDFIVYMIPEAMFLDFAMLILTGFLEGYPIFRICFVCTLYVWVY